MIKSITADDVRLMNGSEGLVLQGCGGNPQEWLDGINDTLTEAGILIDGGKFTDISVFEHDDHTNIEGIYKPSMLLDKHRPIRAVIATHRVRYRPAPRAMIVQRIRPLARERPRFRTGPAA